MNTSASVGKPRPPRWGWGCLLALMFLSSQLTGCAAFHPIRGVPAPYVPPEYLGPSRSGKKTIDLSLLVQTQPDQYRVAGGDTLSIYIPGVLGSLNVQNEQQIGETPPINLSTNPFDPPTIGYPVTIRDDGTISLPYIPPVNVQGMTLPEVERAIRTAYTEKTHVLNGERDRVLVSLQRRREVNVIVVRQETASELTTGVSSGTLNIGTSKRGTARTVRLPAYENDVLHALANSQQGADGLPGLDAKNTIYIIRRKKQPTSGPPPQSGPPTDWPSTLPYPSSSQPSHMMPSPASPRPDRIVDPVPQRRSLLVPPNTPAPTPTTAPPRMPSLPPAQPRPQPESTPLQPIKPRAVPPLPHVPPTDLTPPSSPPSSPTPGAAQESGPPPAWPAPAQPAPSIQRTSGQRGPTAPPLAWPQVRGQSPGGSIFGHSDAFTGNVGWPSQMDGYEAGTMPYSQPYEYGHGDFAPATASPMPGYGGFTPGYAPPDVNLWQSPADDGSLRPPVGRLPATSYAEAVAGHDDSWREALAGFDPTVDNPHVIKIPIRLAEGERPTFTERDIILEDGDIVFIESRETEVFYTGGLLGGGQYTLPRDYDLNVLEAISIAQSPRNNRQNVGRAIGGVSSLNQDVTISASHVVILRSLPNGTRIPIEVDLYKAVRRPQENILIQPGDMLILQYTKIEAIAAFIERHLLEGALFGLASAQFNNTGGN